MRRALRYSRSMPGDGAPIYTVGTAGVETAHKSVAWFVCRPGRTDGCMGPFPITRLDARSPREGLAELESRDQQRTARVRKRARQAVTRMRSDFPGGATTGVPGGDEEAGEQFAALAEDRPCSAVDAATGTCDLYAARPITCGIFGPPVDFGSEAVGVCGLCFQWARDEEIAACEVEIDPRGLESRLPNELERIAGALGQTMLVFAAVPAL